MNGMYLPFHIFLSGSYEHLSDFLVNPDGNSSYWGELVIIVFVNIVFLFLYYKALDRPKCANWYVYSIVVLCVLGITCVATYSTLTNNLNDGLFTVVNEQTGVTECLVRESEIGWFAFASSLDSVLWFFVLSLGCRKYSTNNRRIPSILFKIF